MMRTEYVVAIDETGLSVTWDHLSENKSMAIGSATGPVATETKTANGWRG